MDAKTRINIACPGCGKKFSLSPSWAGKSVQCKKCATHFLVPDKVGGRFETAPFAPQQTQARSSDASTAGFAPPPGAGGRTASPGASAGPRPTRKPGQQPTRKPVNTTRSGNPNRPSPKVNPMQGFAADGPRSSSDSSMNVANFLSEEMEEKVNPADMSFTQEENTQSEKTLPPIPFDMDDDKTRIDPNAGTIPDEVMDPIFGDEEDDEIMDPIFDDIPEAPEAPATPPASPQKTPSRAPEPDPFEDGIDFDDLDDIPEAPVSDAPAKTPSKPAASSKPSASFGSSLIDDEFMLDDGFGDMDEDDLDDIPEAPEAEEAQESADDSRAMAKKVCDACGTLVPMNLNICPNCGYNFITGEDPFGDEFDI